MSGGRRQATAVSTEAAVARSLFDAPQGVNLLPASVRAARDLRTLRRRLALALAGLALLVAGGAGALFVVQGQAQRDADLATDETTRLEATLASYAEAMDVRSQIELVTGAREAAMGTEILWVHLIEQIMAVSPEGTEVVSFSAQGTAPAEGSTFVAPDLLANAGVGTITFSIQTPTLPGTAAWLDALDSIPGFMDASFTSARLSSGRGPDGGPEQYVVASSVQVDVTALSGAYLDPATTPAEGDQP